MSDINTDIKQSILNSCEAMFEPMQVIELRALGLPGSRGFQYNAAGWFNDHEKLAEAASALDRRRPHGVYVTINQLHNACLARGANKTVDRIKATSSDRDVVRRDWLPIDIDPQRPAGVSASMDELKVAREVGKAVADFLEDDLGFSKGPRAFSGNGIHLLYRIDLPNDDESKNLLSRCLAALWHEFSEFGAHVDLTMTNAARIIKLWGTMARKGENHDSRPHRRSVLWNPAPKGSYEIVSRETLDKLAKLSPKPQNSRGVAKPTIRGAAAVKTDGPAPLFDLDGWILRFGVEVARTEPFDGTGVRHILKTCIFDSSHTGSSATLGRTPSGAIFYKCQHDSCQGKDWKAARDYLEGPGSKKPAKSEQDDETAWDKAKRFVRERYTTLEGEILLRRYAETFYQYDKITKVYQEVSTDVMKVNVTRWLGVGGESTTRGQVSDVFNAICGIVTIPTSLKPPFISRIDPDDQFADPAVGPQQNVMVMRNGIIDIDAVLAGVSFADCLGAHTPEWFATSRLNFAFPMSETEAECPLWTAFLNEIFEEDQQRIDIIQEMFGYCFWRSARLEKFFILQGQGANGKSTLLEILKMLLGDENVSSLSLEQVADVTLCNMLDGKLANICNDLPEIDKLEEGRLKRITSGESFTSNRKYKSAVQVTPYCTMIFATNPIPRFTDRSQAIWRRMIIIPVNYQVPPSKIDTRLIEKLAGELPGIFLWALRGSAKIHQTGRFAASEICNDALMRYRVSCFPVLTFLSECCLDSGSENAGIVWSTYKAWCMKFGYTKPKTIHSFLSDLAAFRPNAQIPVNVKGMISNEIVYGLSVNPEVITPVQATADYAT